MVNDTASGSGPVSRLLEWARAHRPLLSAAAILLAALLILIVVGVLHPR